MSIRIWVLVMIDVGEVEGIYVGLGRLGPALAFFFGADRSDRYHMGPVEQYKHKGFQNATDKNWSYYKGRE